MGKGIRNKGKTDNENLMEDLMKKFFILIAVVIVLLVFVVIIRTDMPQNTNNISTDPLIHAFDNTSKIGRAHV